MGTFSFFSENDSYNIANIDLALLNQARKDLFDGNKSILLKPQELNLSSIVALVFFKWIKFLRNLIPKRSSVFSLSLLSKTLIFPPDLYLEISIPQEIIPSLGTQVPAAREPLG